MSLLDELARAERMLALIGDELEARFSDRENVRDAKTSPLFRSYVELLRVTQLAQKQVESITRPQVVNILQIIENEGVPVARRVEILAAAIRELEPAEAEAQGFTGALHRLVGGDRAQQLIEGRPAP